MDAGLPVGFEIASCDVAHTRHRQSPAGNRNRVIGTIHPCRRSSRQWVEAPAETIHSLGRELRKKTQRYPRLRRTSSTSRIAIDRREIARSTCSSSAHDPPAPVPDTEAS